MELKELTGRRQKKGDGRASRGRGKKGRGRELRGEKQEVESTSSLKKRKKRTWSCTSPHFGLLVCVLTIASGVLNHLD